MSAHDALVQVAQDITARLPLFDPLRDAALNALVMVDDEATRANTVKVKQSSGVEIQRRQEAAIEAVGAMEAKFRSDVSKKIEMTATEYVATLPASPAVDVQLSDGASEIFDDVINAMQFAEGALGVRDGADYIALMDSIIKEATKRRDIVADLEAKAVAA